MFMIKKTLIHTHKWHVHQNIKYANDQSDFIYAALCKEINSAQSVISNWQKINAFRNDCIHKADESNFENDQLVSISVYFYLYSCFKAFYMGR